MIQDTAWSPRFVPSTTATAATSGEAIAGTDTTKFITPSLLPAATSYHAGPVVNGRAPRQGLVLDGSNSGSATMGSSIGDSSATVDLLLDIPSSNPATSRGVFTIGPNSVSANYANTFHAELRTDGKLWVNLSGSTTNDYRRVESSSSLVSLFGGKRVRLTVVRDSSAATLAVYVNAVALATTETTGGTAPAWSGNVTGTYFVPGRISASEIHVGYHSLVGFYNRALSTSEVVALYEAGAPAGADYNSASNTSIAVAATNGNFGGFSSTATSITATSTGGTGYCYIPIPLVKGYKYRIQFTSAVAYSGNSLVWRFLGDPGSGSISGTWSNAVNCTPNAGVLQITSTSAASAEFTPDSSDSTAFLHLWEVGITAGSNVSQSGISVTRLGLLLAPDAAQAGGGLVWYDTSGNAANITLPASGVSWNVPTSGYVTSGSSLNLSAGGTNQNITLTPSGTGVINSAFGSNLKLRTSLGTTNVGTARIGAWYSGYVSNADFAAIEMAAAGTSGGDIRFFTIQSGSTLSQKAMLAENGNFLIGTNVDSSALLQVGTNTTTAAGGMKFGTDTSLFRSAAGALQLKSSATAVLEIDGGAGNTRGIVIQAAGTEQAAITVAASGTSLLLSTGSPRTTALTLDSSQNATFAGTGKFATSVTISKTDNPYLLLRKTAATAVDWYLQYNTDGVELYGGTTPAAYFRVLDNGNATFAGTVTPTGGIVGVTTNSNAAAGIVGQYVSSTVLSASAVSMTTGTATNITSISLTAGDWDVSGLIGYAFTGTTSTAIIAGSNSTSATYGTEVTFFQQSLSTTTTNTDQQITIPTRRYSLSATTTIYLIASCDFSAGTVGGYGIIQARRVR